MPTSQRQQAERNITKHRNYIKFIKKYYESEELQIYPDEYNFPSVIRELIKIERKKVRK